MAEGRAALQLMIDSTERAGRVQPLSRGR
jgi:hypothetical protein